MANVEAALRASREAIDQLSTLAQRAENTWTTAPAPGKWSPSQIVEHVALSLEESAKVAAGQPSKFPRLPAIVRPIVRGLVFNRVLKKNAFPKAKTNPAMNPATGPATPADGRARLERAHAEFEAACRRLVAQGARMDHTIFGAVAVEDYVRFMELHARHHGRQMGGH